MITIQPLSKSFKSSACPLYFHLLPNVSHPLNDAIVFSIVIIQPISGFSVGESYF